MDLAGTWELTKTTEVRVDYEKGRLETARAFAYPTDDILGWTARHLQQPAAKYRCHANNAAEGVAVYGNLANNTSAFVYAPALNSGTVLDLAGTVHTTGAQGPHLDDADDRTIPYVGNMSSPRSPCLARKESTTEYLLRLGSGIRLSGSGSDFRHCRADNKPTADGETIIPPSIFVTSTCGQFFMLRIAVNQTLQNRDSYIWSRGLNSAYIDLNKNLPSGAPNPAILQPYSEGPLNLQTDHVMTRENLRAALAYVLDAHQWGKFTFTR